MRVGSMIAVYLLFWTLTLFAVLPWGVKTSEEAGVERAFGEAESAPHQFNLWRKLMWTTIVSAILFGLWYANYVNGWITVDDLPGWRPTEQVG